jgi:hypothetical protein
LKTKTNKKVLSKDSTTNKTKLKSSRPKGWGFFCPELYTENREKCRSALGAVRARRGSRSALGAVCARRSARFALGAVCARERDTLENARFAFVVGIWYNIIINQTKGS